MCGCGNTSSKIAVNKCLQRGDVQLSNNSCMRGGGTTSGDRGACGREAKKEVRLFRERASAAMFQPRGMHCAQT